MEDKIVAGIVQMRRDEDNHRRNYERLLEILGTAGDFDMVFLSENWLSGKPVDLIEYMNIVETISSQKKSTYIFSGCQYTRLGGTVRSIGLTAFNGESRISCEKIFPSHAVGERGRVEPGVYVDPIPTKYGNIGCVACVDVMYPEISRLHALEDAVVIYNPASMPYDRLHLWHSVGVSRAAENQVFFIGVNTVGTRYADGRPTKGGSFVVDPYGNMLFSLTEEEGIFKVELDLSLIREARDRRKYLIDVREAVSAFYERFRFMLTHK
ncbi:MAG: carbon-nitrogen hydrolase family protein [Desulfurococcales archaeon]|nr:carbon-nitrogen hydrolase family protein [Desulfurococcales archaeon]